MLQIPTKIFSFLRGIVKFKNLKRLRAQLEEAYDTLVHHGTCVRHGTPVEKHCINRMDPYIEMGKSVKMKQIKLSTRV